MARRTSEYTHVYSTSDSGKLLHYIRLVPIETTRFPHGIAISTMFDEKRDAELFADEVDKYIKEALWSKSLSAIQESANVSRWDAWLLSAASEGNLSDLKTALANGASLKTTCSEEKNALHLSVSNRTTECMDFLLELGMDIESRNGHGMTVMHYAAQHNDAEKIRYLFGKKADINATDLNGWTPLHYAVWNDLFSVAECLIELDADVTLKNHDGKTAFDLVKTAHYDEDEENEMSDLLRSAMDNQMLNGRILPDDTAVHDVNF